MAHAVFAHLGRVNHFYDWSNDIAMGSLMMQSVEHTAKELPTT
jgi:hypothetical protein